MTKITSKTALRVPRLAPSGVCIHCAGSGVTKHLDPQEMGGGFEERTCDSCGGKGHGRIIMHPGSTVRQNTLEDVIAYVNARHPKTFEEKK